MFAYARSSYTALVLSLGLAATGRSQATWPTADIASETQIEHIRDRALIESQPVCIASSVWSAGTLGETLLYHYRREGNRLYVGYFAHWSMERPWGANALTYAVLPALAVDMVYSHFMFLLPGANALLRGPGDVEGATVVYEEREDGSLEAVGGAADDWLHRQVALTAEDIQGDDGRIVLTTDVWSHQLGVRGAAKSNANSIRCFEGSSLRPMTPDVIDDFRLGSKERPRRAAPAWGLDVPEFSQSEPSFIVKGPEEAATETHVEREVASYQ